MTKSCTKSPATKCASFPTKGSTTCRATGSTSSTPARSTRSASASTSSPSSRSLTAAPGRSSSTRCATTRRRPRQRRRLPATASGRSPTGSTRFAAGCSSSDVQPPVEVRIADFDLAAAAIDHFNRLVIEARERERERLLLAAEIRAIPVELPGKNHQRAFLLDADRALQVPDRGAFELLIQHAGTEGAQRRRRAAGAIHPQVHALVVGNRRVRQTRIVAAQRRAEMAELRRIAADPESTPLEFR